MCVISYAWIRVFFFSVGGRLAPPMCVLQVVRLDGYLGEFFGSCSSCGVGGVVDVGAAPSCCVVFSCGACGRSIFVCGHTGAVVASSGVRGGRGHRVGGGVSCVCCCALGSSL